MNPSESTQSTSTAFSEAVRLAQRALDPVDGVFIATAVSPWHALGVDAWIKATRADGVWTPGVVMILAHPKDGFVIDASHLPYADEDSRTTIVRVDDPPSATWYRKMRRMADGYRFLCARVRNALSARKDRKLPSVSIVSPRRANLRFLLALASNTEGFYMRFRPAFVLVDEGLGTYASEVTWKLVGDLDRGPSAKNSVIREIARRIITFLRSCEMRGIPVESRLLFELDEMTRRLEPVTEIVRDYRALLADAAKRGSAPLPTNDHPTGVVITQPWSEYDQLDAKRELEVVSDAVNMLLARDFRVVIKPHPREVEAKYECLLETFGGRNVEAIQGARPIEEVFRALPPGSCVVGYNSTALLTAAVLYEMPAYSFGRQLIGLRTTGEYLSRAQQEFHQNFDHIVRDISLLLDSGKVGL